MNKDRRTRLANTVSELSGIHEFIEGLKDEEQEYFDAMPESFQGSDKGQDAEAAVDAMDSALTAIEEAKDYLDTAQE